MSDDKHSTIPEENSDDAALSALYRKMSVEEPSEKLDADIIALAKKKIDKPTQPITVTKNWYVPFSIAATIVISSSLFMVMKTEQPNFETQPWVVSQEIKQEKPSPVTVDEFELSDALPERILAKKSSPRTETSIASSFLEKESDVVTTDSFDQEFSMESTISSSTPSLRARSSSEDKLSSEKRDQRLESKTKQVNNLCDQLTEKACLNSNPCTLVLNKKSEVYQCRSSNNYCEQDFLQQSDTAKACSSKANCLFVPKACYCAPEETCSCSGGEPAQCQKKLKPH